jgi:hypothetical protein
MTLVAKQTSEGGYDPIPAGTYQAICYAVIDLGTQYNEKFGVSQRKVRIMWEIPSERISIEKNGNQVDMPRGTSMEYTLSLNEKANLRRDLVSWRGKEFTQAETAGFNITKLLGANCLLQIIHVSKGEKTYANIAGVMKLMPGMTKKEPENQLYSFDIDKDGPEPPAHLPEFVQKQIKKSVEYRAQSGLTDDVPVDEPQGMDGLGPVTEDDIPF